MNYAQHLIKREIVIIKELEGYDLEFCELKDALALIQGHMAENSPEIPPAVNPEAKAKAEAIARLNN